MMFCSGLKRQWLRLKPFPDCNSGSPAARPLALGRLPVPPMQLLYPTAHPGSDRRPPRTGLPERGFIIHPTRRSSLLKTAQWHKPTSRELRTGSPSHRTYPSWPTLRSSRRWVISRDPSGKGSRCYRSRTSSASGYCRVVQCAR